MPRAALLKTACAFYGRQSLIRPGPATFRGSYPYGYRPRPNSREQACRSSVWSSTDNTLRLVLL